MEPKGNKLSDGLLDQNPHATVVPLPTVEPANETPTKPITTTLPTGWATAVSPDNGQTYYYHESSGKSSWVIPTSNEAKSPIPPPPPPPPQASSKSVSKKMYRNTGISRDLTDSDRPDDHTCLAIVACIIFIPLGMIALMYSLKVDKSWERGRPYESIKYSRRAAMFGQVACTLGAIFWIYMLFFSGPGGIFDIHWPAEWFA